MKLTYSHKISGILACSTAMICGILIFSKSVPDLNLLIYGMGVILPASFCAGVLGFFIGKIFDSENKKTGSNQMFK